MDIFSMLQNAPIIDEETAECVGRSVGFEVVNGRMIIKVAMFEIEYEDDDDPPEDGEKDDIPEDDASNIVQKIHAIAGGRDG